MIPNDDEHNIELNFKCLLSISPVWRIIRLPMPPSPSWNYLLMTNPTRIKYIKGQAADAFFSIGGLIFLSSDYSYIVICNGFRGRHHILRYPTLHSFGKAAGQMVQQIILRYIGMKLMKISGKQLPQIVLEE